MNRLACLFFVVALPGLRMAGTLPAQVTARPGPPVGVSIGRLAQVVDAVPYRGSEIRLRAALRGRPTDAEVDAFGGCPVGGGPLDEPPCDPGGYLWMRIDGPPAEGPGEELRAGPVTSGEWSVEEVHATVPADALDLFVGVFLSGDGRMWADDLELAVRKADGTWRRIRIENGDFENVGSDGRPAEWGGIDPPYDARVDHEAPWQGNGAVRIERTAP